MRVQDRAVGRDHKHRWDGKLPGVILTLLGAILLWRLIKTLFINARCSLFTEYAIPN